MVNCNKDIVSPLRLKSYVQVWMTLDTWLRGRDYNSLILDNIVHAIKDIVSAQELSFDQSFT